MQDYNALMKDEIATLNGKKRLLLHSCCAPCSSACVEKLAPYFDITVLFYNPNIDDVEEYEKRKYEQKRFLEQTGFADFIEGDYDVDTFKAMCVGYENEPERGIRCFKCYKLRLDYTARRAAKDGFDYFCTTLTLSPLKNAERLNMIGFECGERLNVKYLPSDFKKENGYLRSIRLSEKYLLYRQAYCGCSYSRRGV